MSLPSPYIESYHVADGVTTSFPFGAGFTAPSAANVKCIIYFADGTNCVPTFTVDVTTGYITIVTLTKPDGTVLTVPPEGSIVRIFRDTPEQQNVTASQLQNYTAKQLERIFDSIVAMIQEVSFLARRKTIRLTETQRDVSVEQLTEEKDQGIIYWDFESRKLKATDYRQDEVVKSETVDRLVYLQPEGKIYFIPKGTTTQIPVGAATIHNDLSGRNAPNCHPESAITGLTVHLQELRDSDTAIEHKAEEALSKASESVETANEAKDIAQDAKDIADSFDDRLTQAEQDASDAKDIAQDASDAVSAHITDTNNPHSVTKAQVGLGNCDNTADLDKPISTATQTALDTKATPADITSAISTHNSDLSAHSSIISPIQEVIPTAATSSNQLADKNFVNSSIATSTATFRGTYNSLAELEAQTADENDYGFVVSTDAAGNTVYNRYKYTTATTPASWVFEYALNNSSFTATQWDAINSGANTTNIGQIATNTSAISSHTGNTSNPHSVTKAQVGLGNADNTADADKPISTATQSALNAKQDTLVAGDNIQIAADGKTISATDTTYTAGTGISIDENNVISNTQTSAEWGNIIGDIEDQTDLKNALDGKANAIHTHHGNDITTGTVYYGVIRSGGSTYSTVEFDSTVNIVKGDTLIVKWNLAQGTSRNLKMNTNGSPSIPLMYKGSQIAENTLSSGDVMQVTYDGSAWQIMSVNKWVAPVPTKTSDLTNDSGFITNAVNDLQNYTLTSDLATVATTGSYTDLLNKPTIPAAQVNSDWNANSGVAQILNKPTLGTAAAADTTDFATAAQGSKADTAVQPSDLATVATSGSYNDLSNKPTIPTVNNPTIIITQGGVTKGSFTLNQASGDTIALDAGGGGSSYHPDLFDWKWADHEISDMSWLRADTFSWQDGTVYSNAYQHLVDDVSGKTLQTETGGGATVSFYLADDGHKICPADQETNIATVYGNRGVAWFYILDTANQRFKLPRTKFGVTGLRDTVGNYVAAGLPNITGVFDTGDRRTHIKNASGAFYQATVSSNQWAGSSSTQGNTQGVGFDASRSNGYYGNSTTVQPPATQQYLYFYVGQFSQSAVEQTAGLNASLFNGKADIDLSNITSAGKEVCANMPMPSDRYVDLTLGASDTVYTAPADGWFTIKKATGINSATFNFRVINDNSQEIYTTGLIGGSGTSDGLRLLFPVKKNDKCQIGYSATGVTQYFRFVYAQGAQ